MDILTWAVVSLLAIAAAAVVGSRVGIAAPLLLTAVGIVVSLLSFVPAVAIEPEWILEGVLPPLLYSAAVSVPTMEFRRDFGAISGLSVILIVISALVLGALFAWLLPGLGLAGGIALGAILSPTDAVVISIMKRLGMAPRAVAVLEGESLLNDATALVLLRSALVGMAASVSLWSVFGTFLYSVAVAVLLGWAVGYLNLRVREHIEDSTVNTAISFTIPFLAALPAEHLGASGLVAAVVAGLVTGWGAPRFLSPRHRLSDSQNWRTIELVLEGAVFLLMGLELSSIIQNVNADQRGIASAFGLAALALLVMVLLRTAYVGPLVYALNAQARRGAAMKQNVALRQKQFEESVAVNDDKTDRPTRPRRQVSPRQMERFQTRVRRYLADIDYFMAEPLGWREGGVIVWAGMRGVVTLAAAQTLPETMPNRSLLVFVAFLVAVGSLLINGGTLPWVIHLLKPARVDQQTIDAERAHITHLLAQATLKAIENETGADIERFRERLLQGDGVPEDDMENQKRLRFRVLDAQRNALLDARNNGEFSAATLSAVLANLDADQISMELKGGPVKD